MISTFVFMRLEWARYPGGEEFFQGGPTSKDPTTFIGCSCPSP
jgi:hypothetical protein